LVLLGLAVITVNRNVGNAITQRPVLVTITWRGLCQRGQQVVAAPAAIGGLVCQATYSACIPQQTNAADVGRLVRQATYSACRQSPQPHAGLIYIRDRNCTRA